MPEIASGSALVLHLERAKALAHFRLTAGHDFFGVYIHWLGLAADEACPFCVKKPSTGVGEEKEECPKEPSSPEMGLELQTDTSGNNHSHVQT
ncbi:hypothetical protein TNCV_310751 [Trichonephila clavipes]|nr:hypothetical protein TNCV_310751 [Trichonephila clavipes]